MSQTFTFTVKYPVGTTVYFGNSSMFEQGWHPHLIQDVVSSFLLNSQGEVEYTFKGPNYRRPECEVFGTKEAVIAWHLAKLNRDFLEKYQRTCRLLDYPPQSRE